MSGVKRPLMTLWSLLLIVALLAGCGRGASSGGDGGSAGGGAGSGFEKVEIQPGERVKVTFWHAMGGAAGEAVQRLVDRFNSSQDRVEVEAAYQGSYDDALQKLKAAGPEGPTIMQVYEIGSRFMIDSGMITPMQNFIDADGFSTEDFEPNILGYYTFDGRLYSMPFNTSTPIVYYNKDAFREVGLDPEKPPRTFEEFQQYARQLTVTRGGETRYGAGIALYGWFFEQFLAVQGAHYVDNDNGRSGRATKAIINSPEGERFVNWLKSMVDEGSAVNLGRKTSETQAAFAAGRIAMTLDSTAALAPILNGVGDKFEVGTAFLPRPQGVDGGVIIGGASLWITNLKSPKEQWAALEFVKWLTQPEVQAEWSMATGYFPIRKAAYEQQALKDWHAQRPQFTTAIEQLRASKLSTVTQGAVIGIFPQARQIVEAAMESVILGQATSAEALTKAAEEITKGIEDYNRTTQ
ncbi:ABC transporter substrate-binding protein [Symbiobacterium terraclitae]|uniref:ABC transporter substrate-binding protein n=1 Tax=Symbiobacterium terraclitae TaxID=557451 RepID=UPI0035B551EA